MMGREDVLERCSKCLGVGRNVVRERPKGWQGVRSICIVICEKCRGTGARPPEEE